MSYWLHPEAEVEAGDAAAYYAQHASKAIAAAFLADFERVLAVIETNQKLGAPAEEGMRTYPFKRFPYSIVYRENGEGPQIYAVAHQHRQPGYWRERL